MCGSMGDMDSYLNGQAHIEQVIIYLVSENMAESSMIYKSL